MFVQSIWYEEVGFVTIHTGLCVIKIGSECPVYSAAVSVVG